MVTPTNKVLVAAQEVAELFQDKNFAVWACEWEDCIKAPAWFKVALNMRNACIDHGHSANVMPKPDDILKLHAANTVTFCVRSLNYIFSQVNEAPPPPLIDPSPLQLEKQKKLPQELNSLALCQWLHTMDQLQGVAVGFVQLLWICSAATREVHMALKLQGAKLASSEAASNVMQLHTQVLHASVLKALSNAVTTVIAVDGVAAKALKHGNATEAAAKAAAAGGGKPFTPCQHRGDAADLRYACGQTLSMIARTIYVMLGGAMSAADSSTGAAYMQALHTSGLLDLTCGCLLATDCSGLVFAGSKDEGAERYASHSLENACDALLGALMTITGSLSHANASVGQSVLALITTRNTVHFAYRMLLLFAEVTNQDLYGEDPAVAAARAAGAVGADGVPRPARPATGWKTPAPPRGTPTGADGAPLPPRATELWPLLSLFTGARLNPARMAGDVITPCAAARVLRCVNVWAFKRPTGPQTHSSTGVEQLGLPATADVAAALRLTGRGLYRLTCDALFRPCAEVLVAVFRQAHEIAWAACEVADGVPANAQEFPSVAVDCWETSFWSVKAAVRAADSMAEWRQPGAAAACRNPNASPVALVEVISLIWGSKLLPSIHHEERGWATLPAPVRQAAARRYACDVAPLRVMDGTVRLAARHGHPQQLASLAAALASICWQQGFAGEVLAGLPPSCPRVAEWDLGLFSTAAKLVHHMANQLQTTPADDGAGSKSSDGEQQPSLGKPFHQELLATSQSASLFLTVLWQLACSGALAHQHRAEAGIVQLLACAIQAAAALARACAPACAATNTVGPLSLESLPNLMSADGFLQMVSNTALGVGTLSGCSMLLAMAASAVAQRPQPQLAAALLSTQPLQLLTSTLGLMKGPLEDQGRMAVAPLVTALAALLDCEEGRRAREWLRGLPAQPLAGQEAPATVAEQGIVGMPLPSQCLWWMQGLSKQNSALTDVATVVRLVRPLSLAAPAARTDEELRLAVLRALASKHAGSLAVAKAACPWSAAAEAAGPASGNTANGASSSSSDSGVAAAPRMLPPLAGWWCGNPGCCNFGGVAEAALTLRPLLRRALLRRRLPARALGGRPQRAVRARSTAGRHVGWRTMGVVDGRTLLRLECSRVQ